MPIGVAVSGDKSIPAVRPVGLKHLIAAEPGVNAAITDLLRAHDPRVTVHWSGPDLLGIPIATPAVERAHDQFRWFAGGRAVNADLPDAGRVRWGESVRTP